MKRYELYLGISTFFLVVFVILHTRISDQMFFGNTPLMHAYVRAQIAIGVLILTSLAAMVISARHIFARAIAKSWR